MIRFEDSVINKWSTYVKKYININNIYFEYLCCYYLHTTDIKDVASEVIKLKEKISRLNKFKKEIKGEYFNCLTGRTEYLIEDGRIIDPENFLEIIDNTDIVEIFGIDFLQKLDKSSGREFKLDEILNENRK